MQPDLLDLHVLHHFRTRSPLTHCMTNDVVQTFTANVLLALGASPAMVIEAEEAEQFAGMADALLINVSTLTAPRPVDASGHRERGGGRQAPDARPGCGGRSGVPYPLLSSNPCPETSRHSRQCVGNSGPCGDERRGRGVDTTDTAAAALPAAQALARQTNAIVAVTGRWITSPTASAPERLWAAIR